MSRRNPRRTTRRGRETPLRFLSAPAWLQQYLERHGPTKVNAVLKFGTLQGFTVAELHRAAAKLNIEVAPGGPGENCQYWRLT